MGRERGSSPVLALGALGVVFGDIGTSPLYALRTILGEGDDLGRDTVYGLTSTVVWSLVVVVTVLYLNLLMRTDNEGEGGLLAQSRWCGAPCAATTTTGPTGASGAAGRR